MKSGKLIIICGFILLASAITYSMQQLSLAKQSQVHMQSLIETQEGDIKALKVQIKAIKKINKNNKINHIVMDEITEATTIRNTASSPDLTHINSLNKQLAALTIKVKEQSQTLQNLQLNANQVGYTATNATTESITQSIEEMDAQADEQTKQFNQNMENYWQQQEIATEWAKTLEETVQTNLTEAQEFTLNEISCKTDVCRLEMTTTGNNEKDPTDWILDNIETPEVHTQTKINDDGSESFVIYLSKEGSSLLANIN